MTGVKLPAGVVGASAVLGNHVAHGTLPFTGAALGIYVAAGTGLVVTGIAMRLFGKSEHNVEHNA
jgi:multisubunit Na+/H+ antiporter MnhB subunit